MACFLCVIPLLYQGKVRLSLYMPQRASQRKLGKSTRHRHCRAKLRVYRDDHPSRPQKLPRKLYETLLPMKTRNDLVKQCQRRKHSNMHGVRVWLRELCRRGWWCVGGGSWIEWLGLAERVKKHQWYMMIFKLVHERASNFNCQRISPLYVRIVI